MQRSKPYYPAFRNMANDNRMNVIMGDEVQSPDWKKTERCSARQIKVLSAEKQNKNPVANNDADI